MSSSKNRSKSSISSSNSFSWKSDFRRGGVFLPLPPTPLRPSRPWPPLVNENATPMIIAPNIVIQNPIFQSVWCKDNQKQGKQNKSCLLAGLIAILLTENITTLYFIRGIIGEYAIISMAIDFFGFICKFKIFFWIISI